MATNVGPRRVRSRWAAMTLEGRRRRANRSAWARAREGGTDKATRRTIQSDDVRSCSGTEVVQKVREARPYRHSRPLPTRRPGPRRSILPAGAALAVEAVEAAGARVSPLWHHRGVGGLESGQPGDQPAGALAFRDTDDRLRPRRKEIRTALGNYQTDKHSSVKTSLAGRLAGTIISLPRTPPGSTTLRAGPRASASFRGVPALSAGCCAGVRGHTQAHRYSSRSFQWRRSCITFETSARGRARTLATGLFG